MSQYPVPNGIGLNNGSGQLGLGDTTNRSQYPVPNGIGLNKQTMNKSYLSHIGGSSQYPVPNGIGLNIA